MRFLMVCMQYPTGPGQSYMTTELADAMTAAGHVVEVLHLDWSGRPGELDETFVTPGGVRVVRCAPRAVQGLGELVRGASKFLLSGGHVARIARRHFELGGFDAMIAWMPAVAIAPLVSLARRVAIRHRLLFIWDFFPDHHRQIGRMPGGPVYRIARAWEQRLLATFTAVICTLPGNADYLRREYRLGAGQRVLVTPIWSETAVLKAGDPFAIRLRHGLPLDRPIAVFGGQLVEGRGFEQMLAAADTAKARGSRLLFLFVGEGRFSPMLKAQAARGDAVGYLPSMSRRDYLELLGACDVGMVATTPGVTSFSIPTKTIDYLRAGLPVIAAVERGNDFVAILDRYAVGRAVAFGDAEGFGREAERLATDPAVRAAVRAAAPRCLDAVFDVRHAVRTVLDAVDG
jgi:glycosyltransferase involved in cell wall biosynthesis